MGGFAAISAENPNSSLCAGVDDRAAEDELMDDSDK
jgi:hypothetical protein